MINNKYYELIFKIHIEFTLRIITIIFNTNYRLLVCSLTRVFENNHETTFFRNQISPYEMCHGYKNV